MKRSLVMQKKLFSLNSDKKIVKTITKSMPHQIEVNVALTWTEALVRKFRFVMFKARYLLCHTYIYLSLIEFGTNSTYSIMGQNYF